MNYPLEDMVGDDIKSGIPLIYKITSPSNKIYVGQSWDWKNRRSKYKTLNCKGQIYLFRSFEKHGVNNHIFEIASKLQENSTQLELDNEEIYWWKYYKDLGFEMLNIREPGRGGKHSEESKMKISLSNKGEKNKMYGKKGKDHPSYGNEGYFKNWKEKGIIHPMIGRTGDKATCFGRTGDKHPMFGKTDDKSPFAKKVINTVTGEIYLSVKSAAKILNLNYSALTKSLRNSDRKRRKLKHLEYLK